MYKPFWACYECFTKDADEYVMAHTGMYIRQGENATRQTETREGAYTTANVLMLQLVDWVFIQLKWRSSDKGGT